jgi:hypothetical protein
MEEDSILINNIKQSIDNIIYERSYFLMENKFLRYRQNIEKIYSQFNINKSRRIDALGSCQIDINYFDQVLILILKETNLFILEISSPKDILLSFFLITSQREKEMEGIIQKIKYEIISKNLTDKYNYIFYIEKIKPLFTSKKSDEIINEEEVDITHETRIVEYNSKGKKIKDTENIIKENEFYLQEYYIKYKDNNNYQKQNSEYKNQITNNISISYDEENFKQNKNVLYIEALPHIIGDYIKDNPNIVLVEIDEEFNKELELNFNKKLLYKIKEYDEVYARCKNIENNMNIIIKELNQYYIQLRQVQNSIQLYEQIIIDKKNKSENIIFLEDMQNKLREKKNNIMLKINELKDSSFILNNNMSMNTFSPQNKLNNNLLYSEKKNSNLKSYIDNIKEMPKLKYKINSQNSQNKIIIPKYKLANSTTNINKLSKFNNNESTTILNLMNKINSAKNNNNNFKNILMTKNSILKTITSLEKRNINTENNNNKTKAKLPKEITEDLIKNSLNDIFNFYSSLFDNNSENNKYIDFDSFKKFCKDFKIYINDNKIEEFFFEIITENNNNSNNDNSDNRTIINFSQFNSLLNKISLQMHELKKQKLQKIIIEKKNIKNYMELREYMRQEEEKLHNKFTERITGGIAKRSLEKNQYDFVSKYKKLKSDISKYEFDYEKEAKKSEAKIFEDFCQYIGIGYEDNSNHSYKNKIKIKSNIFVENALKKYGYMDIFKNYKISPNGETDKNNFNINNINSLTNRNNSLTFKFTTNKFNKNNINISSEKNIFKKKIYENRQMNERYNKNIQNINEIEEIGLYNKKMNKNFSSFELTGKNKFNHHMKLNILPQIGVSNNNNININNKYNDDNNFEDINM